MKDDGAISGHRLVVYRLNLSHRTAAEWVRMSAASAERAARSQVR